MKIVTAGVIRNDTQQVLVVRRASNQSLGGFWEFPGGKIEPGENEQVCLKREISEELDIEIEVGDFITQSHYVYEHGEFLLKAFEVRMIGGEPTLTVHDQMAWVDPVDLDKYNLALADIPIARTLVKRSTDDLRQRSYNINNPEEARDLYRDWASSYDQHLVKDSGYVAPTLIAQMLSVAEVDHNVQVLDVGCGTGLVGACLSKLGFTHLDGLDFSSEMLEKARKKGIYRELIQADLNEPLDFIQSTYGAAISCGTFGHTGHADASALGRIAPLLKPSAIFACTITPAMWDDRDFARTLEDLRLNSLLEIRKVYERGFYDGSKPDGHFCILQRP
tara:strand:+ start:2247 stop:3248 length:1002 start_codon:yes stop_codon:yes gene_type:complete